MGVPNLAAGVKAAGMATSDRANAVSISCFSWMRRLRLSPSVAGPPSSCINCTRSAASKAASRNSTRPGAPEGAPSRWSLIHCTSAAVSSARRASPAAPAARIVASASRPCRAMRARAGSQISRSAVPFCGTTGRAGTTDCGVWVALAGLGGGRRGCTIFGAGGQAALSGSAARALARRRQRPPPRVLRPSPAPAGQTDAAQARPCRARHRAPCRYRA